MLSPVTRVRFLRALSIANPVPNRNDDGPSKHDELTIDLLRARVNALTLACQSEHR